MEKEKIDSCLSQSHMSHKMQTGPSSIWTRLVESICYSDNCYITIISYSKDGVPMA